MKVAERHDEILDLSANHVGAAFGIDHLDGYSITILFIADGSLDGSVKLQGTASNPFTDNVNMTPNPDAIWDDIADSEATVSTSSSSVVMYNAKTAYYRGVRLVFTNTSGDGVYVADWSAKGSA